MRIMGERQWLETFEPLESPSGSYVWEHGEVVEASTPSDHVWTLTDNGDKSMTVSNGFHFVNRVGYVVTKRPWTEDIAADW